MFVSTPKDRGGIRVRTTERGLPTAIVLNQRALDGDPSELAREILLLCQLSGQRAQVARRRELIASGAGAAVLRALKLSTEEELAETVQALHGEGPDDLPESWMVRL
jgi:hypothetical protein